MPETFKSLVEGALYDSDTGGRQSIPEEIGPAETTGQQWTATRFVREAWRRIQQDDEQWLWMRQEFTTTLVPDRAVYAWDDLLDQGDPPAQLLTRRPRTWLAPLTSDSIWYLDDPVGNTIRNGILPQLVWQQFRARSMRRSTPVSRRPTAFAVRPDQKLAVDPAPDAPYLIKGEMQAGVHVFGTDMEAWNEAPELLPGEYHEMIKWAAIMMIHGFDEANESFVFARNEYAKDHNNMKRLHLPGYEIAPAIGSGSVRTSSFGGDRFGAR